MERKTFLNENDESFFANDLKSFINQKAKKKTYQLFELYSNGQLYLPFKKYYELNVIKKDLKCNLGLTQHNVKVNKQ